MDSVIEKRLTLEFRGCHKLELSISSFVSPLHYSFIKCDLIKKLPVRVILGIGFTLNNLNNVTMKLKILS